jgi:UTP-glucose-1-phosphate uridylyltransferase
LSDDEVEEKNMLIGIIPCAGKGTRMAGTITGSKEMQIVHGRPVIDYCIDQMLRARVDKIVVVVPCWDEDMNITLMDPHGDMIYYLRNANLPCDIEFVEQGGFSIAKDLPAAILSCWKQVYGHRVVMAMPDTIFFPDTALRDMALTVMGKKGVQVGLFHVEDPSRFGMVQLDTAFAKIMVMIDKPTDKWALDLIREKPCRYRAWGCLAWDDFTSPFMNYIRTTPGSVCDILNAMESDGYHCEPHLYDRYWDIGTPADLEKVRGGAL